MSDPIISVEHLGKCYRIRHQQERQRYVALRDVIAERTAGVARRLRSALRSSPLGFGQAKGQGEASYPPAVEEFWALRDVSFEVKPGEVVGIIGRNGAGKSTLLKILSQITEPTEGRVRLRGRVASLLEVGTGFHPELTGRENIFLNGAILGMCRAEIRKKFDEIVAFAEVEKFLDTPVKRYSSGMYVRLAFAVAAHLEPEILIVDEVLAVGDAEFQRKCLGKMQNVAAQEGRTVLFVSHNMAAVTSLCSTGMLLRHGGLARWDGIQKVVQDYGSDSPANGDGDLINAPRTGTGVARVQVFRSKANTVLVDGGCRRSQWTFEIDYEAQHENVYLTVWVGIYDAMQSRILFLDSASVKGLPQKFPRAGNLSITLSPHFLLYPGRYTVNLALIVDGQMADYLQAAAAFVVEECDFFGSGRMPSVQGVALVAQDWCLNARPLQK